MSLEDTSKILTKTKECVPHRLNTHLLFLLHAIHLMKISWIFCRFTLGIILHKKVVAIM